MLISTRFIIFMLNISLQIAEATAYLKISRDDDGIPNSHQKLKLNLQKI